MIIDNKEFRDLSLKMVEDGYLLMFGDFNNVLEEIVIECLLRAKTSGKKKLTLLINSGGGFNGTFSAIKAAMLETRIEFIGLVLGRAASNAFNILQQCTERLAVRDAYVMFHWGTQQLNNSELSALIAGQDWPMKNSINAELLNARLVFERTGVPIETLKEFAMYERWFQAEEALEINFIDAIIDDLPASVSEKLGIKKVTKKKK